MASLADSIVSSSNTKFLWSQNKGKWGTTGSSITLLPITVLLHCVLVQYINITSNCVIVTITYSIQFNLFQNTQH